MVTRLGFKDFYMETMLPALNREIGQKWKQRPTLFKRLFTVVQSERSIEQFTSISGVGLLTLVDEAANIRYDEPVQGFDKTFKPRKYGLAVPISKEAVDDSKFLSIKRMVGELAMSAKETRELQAASVFNNAFDGASAGPDGVALCSTSHPLEKAGGVQTNRLSEAADLDVTSLQLALTEFELTKRSDGKLLRIPARHLVVASANRWNAFEITKSELRSDTANNAANTFKYGDFGTPDPFVWPHLSDPDAWFLVSDAENTGLVWVERKAPYQDRWYDDAAEVMYEAIRYRADLGWYDFRGVYGSPGA